MGRNLLILSVVLALTTLSSCSIGGPIKGESSSKEQASSSQRQTSQSEQTSESLTSSERGDAEPSSSLFSSEEVSHMVRFFLDGELVKSLSVKDGLSVSAPSSDELPEGYAIDYWHAYGEDVPWSFDENKVTYDLDLYAQFKYKTYIVTLAYSDGSDEYEVLLSYKQSYDFSDYYKGKADHLENEQGVSYPLVGTWLTTHGEALAPVFKEQAISYGYYELLSPLTEGGKASTSKEEIQGVYNPNPSSLSGKAKDLNAALEDASKEGYRFEGWYRLISADASKDALSWRTYRLTTLHDGYFGTKICALFLKCHSLSVSVNDPNAGKAEFVGEKLASACFGDTISVKAAPIGDGIFEGWYDGENLLSKADAYTFTMPAEDLSLEAVFSTRAEKESLGILPSLDSESGTLTYGLYPQTHVSDEAIVSSLNKLSSPEANGWYLLDGVYYAKKQAIRQDTLTRSGHVFDDGTEFIEGAVYWFRCEPISWRILFSSDDEYSLVSTLLLDAHRFDDSSDNYANSEIREWLNGTFYSSAFALNDSLIKTSTIDNSASTMSERASAYACENTEDKVYLLSYQDYLDDAGYFASPSALCCKTTDWARASGAYSDTGSSYLYNGYYWTRSPYGFLSNGQACAACVAYWGISCGGEVNFTHTAVRPAITIKLA